MYLHPVGDGQASHHQAVMRALAAANPRAASRLPVYRRRFSNLDDASILAMGRMTLLGSGAAPGGFTEAAPTLTGAPTLLASWNPNDAASLTLEASGARIGQMAGVDGTTGVTLARVASINAGPLYTTRSGRKTVDIVLADADKMMAFVGNLGIGSAGATVFLVVEPKTAATTQVFYHAGVFAGNNLTHTHQLAGIASAAWRCRKSDASATSVTDTGTLATGIHLLIGRYPPGSTPSKCNIDGQGTAATNGTSVAATTSIDRVVLGGGMTSSAYGTSADAYYFRGGVYQGDIGDTACEELAVWSAAVYGTSNAA